MKVKVVNDGSYLWTYSFTYDTGYRLTHVTVMCKDVPPQIWTYTYNYTLSHDLRGNIRACSVVIAYNPPNPPPPTVPPRPIDLPDTLKYDSHNRLVEYIVSGTPTKTVKLYYDPIGRILRKEHYTGAALDLAIHYYHSGGNLIQEFDEMIVGGAPKDVIIWDYLRGLGGQVVRRRRRNGVNNYTDMLHFNDMMGTVREETNPVLAGGEGVGAPYGYVVTADGEPLAMTQPSDLENHIQYHGGFLEDSNFHTNPLTVGPMGYFYRMGIRHYSPALGRFLQRDPFTYMRRSNIQFPLNANAYIYAYNQPLMHSDPNGYQPIPPIMPMPLPGGEVPIGGGICGDGCGFHKRRISVGGGPGTGGDEGSNCMIPMPEECGTCPSCCLLYGDPPWTPCCPSVWVCPYDPSDTERKMNSDECQCVCCLGRGGGQNAPAYIGDGQKGKPVALGAPRIGLGGTGGDTMQFFPYYNLFMRSSSCIFPISAIPVNSLRNSDISPQSNISGSISQMSVGAIGGIGDAIKYGGLLSAAGNILFCGLILGISSLPKEGCNATVLQCLCLACKTFADCGLWPLIGVVGLSVLALIGGLFFPPIWGAIPWIIGGGTLAVVTYCRLKAVNVFRKCMNENELWPLWVYNDEKPHSKGHDKIPGFPDPTKPT